MDDEVYCCFGCIIVIFLIFAGFSVFDTIYHWGGNNYDTDNIYVTDLDTSVTNFSFEQNGRIEGDYLYSVFYNLNNISISLEGGEIVTYLYSGDDVVLSDEISYYSNNSTSLIEEEYLVDGFYPVSAQFNIDNLTNVTHCVIVIIKDGNILFNITQPFNMNNYENYESNNYTDDLDDDELSNSDDLNNEYSGRTYVASIKSDKFHEPSCSQAKKIKDGNKITFSSRDEAINSGYSPCGYCYP